MIIPLKALIYLVAIGNGIHLILWSILEVWILAGLFLALKDQSNPWVYVECNPITFYIILIKFFGICGAYYYNYMFIVVHIMLSTIYMLSIALSLIHLSLFAAADSVKPNALQKVLSVIYHLSNFALLILSLLLFLSLRAIYATNVIENSEESEELPDLSSTSNETKTPNNPLFKRLVPK